MIKKKPLQNLTARGDIAAIHSFTAVMLTANDPQQLDANVLHHINGRTPALRVVR